MYLVLLRFCTYFYFTVQEATAEEVCQNTSQSSAHDRQETKGIISGTEKQSEILF